MKSLSELIAPLVLLALAVGCTAGDRPRPSSRAALAGDLDGTYYAWAESHYWAFEFGQITWRNMILTVDGDHFEYDAVFNRFVYDDLVHCNPTFRGDGRLFAAGDSLTLIFSADAEPFFPDIKDLPSMTFEVKRKEDKLLLTWDNRESNDVWLQWITIEMSPDSTIDWPEVDWDTL